MTDYSVQSSHQLGVDMPSKKQPKPGDKEQSNRFIEKAREVEADESGEAFERVFKKIVPQKRADKGDLPNRDQRRAPPPQSS